jgi:hypothetical protein
MLDIEELLATRLLVQGNSGSGKSHLLRRLLEQSAQWVQQVIIDPEGDFVTLSEKYGHLVVDGERSEGELAGIASRIRKHRVSCVLSLEGLEIDDQMRAAATFLNAMFDAEHEHWYPVLVVVDEAQMFAPAAGGEVAEDARKMSLGAMTNLMCRGRKRGTGRRDRHPAAGETGQERGGRSLEFPDGPDLSRYRHGPRRGSAWAWTGGRRRCSGICKRGNFVGLGPALSRRPLPIAIGDVETQARSSSPKLMPMPEAVAGCGGSDFHARCRRADHGRSRRRARPAPRPTTDILAELSQATPLTEAPLSSPSGGEAATEGGKR